MGGLLVFIINSILIIVYVYSTIVGYVNVDFWIYPVRFYPPRFYPLRFYLDDFIHVNFINAM